jgi:hypothetical protein
MRELYPSWRACALSAAALGLAAACATGHRSLSTHSALEGPARPPRLELRASNTRCLGPSTRQNPDRGRVIFRAKITGTIHWCPESVEWFFGDGSSHRFDVSCEDRGPWSADHSYRALGRYYAGMRIYESAASIGEGGIWIDVGEAGP